jgi:hypothetical protein
VINATEEKNKPEKMEECQGIGHGRGFKFK